MGLIFFVPKDISAPKWLVMPAFKWSLNNKMLREGIPRCSFRLGVDYFQYLHKYSNSYMAFVMTLGFQLLISSTVWFFQVKPTVWKIHGNSWRPHTGQLAGIIAIRMIFLPSDRLTLEVIPSLYIESRIWSILLSNSLNLKASDIFSWVWHSYLNNQIWLKTSE